MTRIQPGKTIRTVMAGICLLAMSVAGQRDSRQPELAPPLRLHPDDRILVLAPHPDDEVLGCAGIVQEAVKQRLPVHIGFFTYGDDNEKSFLVYRKHPVWRPGAVRRMGLIRHEEALAAARVLGLAPEQLSFLGYPDGGGLEIWRRHWDQEPAYLSHRTKERKVPYANALRPGAPYKGEDIVQDISAVVAQFRPTKIFVAHPGDHHPDHQTLPLFLQVALWDLKLEQQPLLYPYLIHHQHWPKPFGYHPRERLFPPPGFSEKGEWHPHGLDPAAVATKEQALKAHRTQYEYSAPWLHSFIRQNELFGSMEELTLAPDSELRLLGSNAPAQTVTPPEHLTAEEKESFVGLLHHAVAWEGGELVIHVRSTRPLPPGAQLFVSAFGYRADQDFSRMPKLLVAIEAGRFSVWDQARELPAETVEVTQQGTEFTVKMPLAAVQEPHKLFLGVHTHTREVHLDSLPWRIVDLER